MARDTLPRHEPTTSPVSYRPQQESAEAITLGFRDSPLKLLLADTKLFFTVLRWLPRFFTPIHTQNPYSELYCNARNIQEIVLHIILGILGTILALLSVPVLFLTPLSVFLLYLVLLNGLLFLLCFPLNKGPRSLVSRVDLEDTEIRPDEKWAFVNGVCAGQHWLQANVDMLSSTFRRPIYGIHNRSYGLAFDLMECVVQRCFSYPTKDTRRTYDYLKEFLVQEDIKKLVVIAHSQGGIILSTALDMLFADLPSEALEKLEIYTFGCAANHFNNPLCRLPASPAQDMPSRRTGAPEIRQVHHIEHYCNEYDFVARFGALHFTRDKTSTRFAGKVFQHMGQGGHLLNQHYIDVMFSSEDSVFLNQAVGVDEETTSIKNGETRVTEVPTGPSHGEAEVIQMGELGVAPRVVVEGNAGSVAERRRAPTVKELSRLWRYRNGASPHD